MLRLPFLVLAAVLVAATSVPAQSTNPFDGLNSGGRVYADPASYAEARSRWLERVRLMPDNVDVLEGAALFLIVRDRPLAEEFATRLQALEPRNPKWPTMMAMIHRMNLAASGDLNEARQALVLLEKADALAPPANRPLPTNLPMAAFAAGDMLKARAYADRLLAEAKAHRGQWDYANAIHSGNTVLGRIAVRESRYADAVKFLHASADVPGSPTLNSFGPAMLLAKELLEAGEPDAVLAYFESCRVFWKMGGERLDEWARDVRAGRAPNFGPNLSY